MIREFLANRRYMREHRWTHAHLSEYVDEDLPRGDVARVEAHVGICPQCRRVLATLRRTLDGLRSLHEDAEVGITEGIIERLRHEP